MTTDEVGPIEGWRDRWSGSPAGVVVLDIGEQPPSDLFPLPTDPLPDPRHRLRMVLGTTTGLLQLEHDPTTPEEIVGVEPAALVRQAEVCVANAVTAGLIRRGSRVIHYPSPHGGSWHRQLEPFGLTEVETGHAELVVDVHGMMHAADQKQAFRERRDRLTADGVLLFLIHNASAMVREGMWNALKSGHFAYYTTPSLVRMGNEIGLTAIGAWSYSLYHHGTTMLAFARADGPLGNTQAMAVTELVRKETGLGVLQPTRLRSALQTAFARSANSLRAYLDSAEVRGLTLAGYGAASRTGALLTSAGVTVEDLAMIADASPAKHGRTMPVSRIPIVAPQDLAETRPDRVLLFISDLLPEVRAALPEIEASGGRWVVADPVPTEVQPVRPR